MSNTMKVFTIHYNKPASKKAGVPRITVHHNKTCHIVNNVVCNTKTWGHINKRQPYFVIKGKCEHLEIKNGIAHIN